MKLSRLKPGTDKYIAAGKESEAKLLSARSEAADLARKHVKDRELSK